MKKHIPNMITLCNLLCGCVAVIYAIKGAFVPAWLFVILAAVFDFFDGFAARALGAYSNIGKELDSLCDVVSFGVAPSLAFYACYHAQLHELQFLEFFPLAVAACSALRLAKFNLDERQTKSFLGLPTPACGLLMISLAAYNPVLLSTEWFIPALSAVLSALLVSEIPMFSMKKKSSRLVIFFIGIAVIAVVCFAFLRIEGQWWLTVSRIMAYAFILYILINLIPAKSNETN